MALGRQGARQADLVIGWAELPRSPGHAFYDRLQAVLVEAGFDRFAEGECAPHYASKRGRPSLPPGRYFRMHLVGSFEGIDSERGLEWRCADSLSLREFLRPGTTEPVPDHSWLSKRHRQVKLEEDGEARKLARAANLCGGFGASDLGPHREGLRADGSVLDGRKGIAVEVGEVVDLVVRREEPLRLAG